MGKGRYSKVVYVIGGVVAAVVPGAIPIGLVVYGVKKYRDSRKCDVLDEERIEEGGLEDMID